MIFGKGEPSWNVLWFFQLEEDPKDLGSDWMRLWYKADPLQYIVTHVQKMIIQFYPIWIHLAVDLHTKNGRVGRVPLTIREPLLCPSLWGLTSLPKDLTQCQLQKVDMTGVSHPSMWAAGHSIYWLFEWHQNSPHQLHSKRFQSFKLLQSNAVQLKICFQLVFCGSFHSFCWKKYGLFKVIIDFQKCFNRDFHIFSPNKNVKH